MLMVAIILGSTRPGRNGEAVARWVYNIAKKRSNDDTEFEYVDIKDFNLPLLDERFHLRKVSTAKTILKDGQLKSILLTLLSL
jgi:NAD(P)H-dependent FMN reductase